MVEVLGDDGLRRRDSVDSITARVLSPVGGIAEGSITWNSCYTSYGF